MSSKHLNHLKRHRRRLAFSQDEIAFLLGGRCGSKMSRYECFVRCPKLVTALAYEIIFGISVRELFMGTYEETKSNLVVRAKVLRHRLKGMRSSCATRRKLASLEAIISSQTKK